MSVVTTTLGTAGSVGSSAAELLNKMEAEMLQVAQFESKPLEDLFRPFPITNANTMQWTRMERLPVALTPAQAEEGITPDSIGVTINKVTATLEQYVTAIAISELAQLTASHDIVREAIERVGTNMGDTRIMLLYNVANAATNIYRVASRTTDNAIAVGDTLSYEETVGIHGTLAINGVPKFPDGTYHLVAPTAMYESLKTDPNWLALNQFKTPEDIRDGIVGRLDNLSIVESNHFCFGLTASTTSGNSSAIRSAFAAGAGWGGVTELDSADRKLFVDPPGTMGNDSGRQRYTITWKMTFKSVILNQGFGRKVRASCFDATAV